MLNIQKHNYATDAQKEDSVWLLYIGCVLFCFIGKMREERE